MANLALVSLDINHGAATATTTALESLGHTVTKYTSASATKSVLKTYDVIFWVRGADNAAYTAEVIGAFNDGIPVISAYAGGVNVTSNMPMQAANLVSGSVSTTGFSSQNSVQILESSPYFSGLGGVGDTVQVASSSTFIIPIDVSQIADGVNKLSCAPGLSAKINIMVAPKGTINLLGSPTPAPMAHLSFMYSSYAPDGTTILGRVLDSFLTPPKVISGVITDVAGNLVQRKVIAVNLTTDLVSAVTTSDVDGTYSFSLDGDAEHAVFCVDNVAAPLIYVG